MSFNLNSTSLTENKVASVLFLIILHTFVVKRFSTTFFDLYYRAKYQ